MSFHSCKKLLVWLVAGYILGLALSPEVTGKSPDDKERLSPASLELDWTIFYNPGCELQNSWTIEKTFTSGDLMDPVSEPFLFDVKVTEGSTSTVLSGSGILVITNTGQITTPLTSIVVMLEDHTPGAGDSFGPSGGNWTVIGAVAENTFLTCGSTTPLAYRLHDGNPVVTQTPGANLVLYNCDDKSDVITLVDQVMIPSIMEADPVEICFEYTFDMTGLGIEGAGDGIVPSADDLRINTLVTFDAGGKRGGTVPTDIDCDGDLEDYVRTIQQRYEFDPPT